MQKGTHPGPLRLRSALLRAGFDKLRATPPERGWGLLPSREGCRVSGGVGCPPPGGLSASGERESLEICITRLGEG